MRRSNSGFSTVILLVVALGAFGGVLWFNSAGTSPIVPIIPTEGVPTSESLGLSDLLDTNFGNNASPEPVLILPVSEPTRPVVAQAPGPTATPISASDASNQGEIVSVSVGATPTLPPPTANAPVQAGTSNPDDWNLPALVPPLSRDPQGRDHYWFRRPIESNANNSVLLSYTYGTGGFFGSRIHHGIDMPNPAGEEVYAPASGTVIFASDGRNDDSGVDIFQNTAVYGNVVFIRHDFGYQGQPIYTLYAHLLTSIVSDGDIVQAGDPIGLVGSTGQVTGSHVHFEVRIGGDGDQVHPAYGDTYNPTLWMVPYVGHGVIAGRVVDINGEYIDNVTVTIRNRLGVVASVPTYTFQNTVNDVNPDPRWGENFAVGDIREGTYDVLVRIDGQLVIEQVTVLEGMTTMVELRLDALVEPTATIAPTNSETTGTDTSDG